MKEIEKIQKEKNYKKQKMEEDWTNFRTISILIQISFWLLYFSSFLPYNMLR
jgi:hypothetical protein